MGEHLLSVLRGIISRALWLSHQADESPERWQVSIVRDEHSRHLVLTVSPENEKGHDLTVPFSIILLLTAHC